MSYRCKWSIWCSSPTEVKRAAVKIVKLTFLFFLVIASTKGQIVREGYDLSNTLSNPNEAVLNSTTVSTGGFGKLFTQPVDGAIYAQPLYISGVTINGATHNVVYVATMNDVVYAFDADTLQPALWETDFRSANVVPVPSPGTFIADNIGIEGTPTIDLATNTMYLVAYTKESGALTYRLHALDITTGAEKFGGSVPITATFGSESLDPAYNMQRPGLTIVNGQVIIAFGSFGDIGTYHGWLLSYIAGPGLAQTSAICITPTGSAGAIWMTGAAPVVDGLGYVYVVTGNGTFDGTALVDATNLGDSIVKYSVSSNGLAQVDYYAPTNATYLGASDLDLGSGGPLLVPGANLIVAGGKQSQLQVVSTTNMGHQSTPTQTIALGNPMFNSVAYYNRPSGLGPWMYLWTGGPLTAYHFNGTTFDKTPVSQSTIQAPNQSYSGAFSISSNNYAAGSGIVWVAMPAVTNSNQNGAVAGIVRAFNADDLTQELWDSGVNAARDNSGLWAKFRPPVVANGKVYVGAATNSATGTTASLTVYGLLPGGGSTASFVSTDPTTEGNWEGAYGSDGYLIANSTQKPPSYAVIKATNTNLYTWTSETSDKRALETTGGRIASAWYTNTNHVMTFDINVTDGQSHNISLYLLDWDAKGRAETVQVQDAVSSAVLDSRAAVSFSNGIYFVWTISGHVKIVVTATAGPNGVVSGFFFDPSTNGNNNGGNGNGGTGGTGGTGNGGTVSVSLTWTAVTGATSYTIERATSPSGPWTVIGTSSTTSYTDTTVQHGQSYFYQFIPVVAVQ